MATICIYSDAEEGHLLPTLMFAKKLKSCGYSITFLSFECARETILEQGLEFIPIFEEILSPGVRSAVEARISALFGPLVRGQVLDRIVAAIRPCMFITLTVFSLEAIVIRYKYDLPVVLMRAHCIFESRQNLSRRHVIGRLVLLSEGAAEFVELLKNKRAIVRNFNDIADLALQMPEVVLFPREFAPVTDVVDDSIYYVGVGSENPLSRPSVPWEPPDYNHPIIYCTLGSQSYLRHNVSKRFFEVVLETFATLPDYQLILSTGKGHPVSFKPYTQNEYVTEWAPQLSVLARAFLMITHGGGGTVRECITNGIPMIVVPLMRDQFECSDMIVRHGLGLRADVEKLTSNNLKALILQVATDLQLRRRVLAMRKHFLRTDWSMAIYLVEQLVAQTDHSPTKEEA